MDATLKAKLDYANDLHKQMLALATGVLALTAGLFGNQAKIAYLVYVSWGILIFSILVGITAMGSLIDYVESKTAPGRSYMIVQSWSFLIGLILFVTSVIFLRG